MSSLRDVGGDWPRTMAWGEGGYYARVFLNVKGREPDGVVEPDEYEAVRNDLARRIAAIPDDEGNPISTKVYKPEELYGEPQGVAPDLIVVFGDLLWRSVGTIGGDEGIQTLENDTGPDDANHAQDGLYIVAGRGVDARGRADAHLLDIAPTVLELLEIKVPEGMRGTSLLPLLARYRLNQTENDHWTGSIGVAAAAHGLQSRYAALRLLSGVRYRKFALNDDPALDTVRPFR